MSKIINAMSGLALLVTTSCATAHNNVDGKPYLTADVCMDGQYEDNNVCLEEEVKDIYESVYVVSTDTLLEDVVVDNWQGSGVLLENRVLLTANHLIHNEEKQIFENSVTKSYIKVDDTKYLISEITSNKEFDYALMRIPNIKGLKYFNGPINSSGLSIGNAVYIAGNSAGLGINFRDGVVSQINEKDFGVSNGVNPGDSGCPVFAIRDGIYELVGIVSSGVRHANGLGYAIDVRHIEWGKDGE